MKYVLGEKRTGVLRDDSPSKDATSDANSSTSDAKKRRMNKEELRVELIRVCKECVSLEDIVTEMGRSSSYVRNSVIPRMMREGIIEMMYPGTPNHPKQKYKVKE